MSQDVKPMKTRVKLHSKKNLIKIDKILLVYMLFCVLEYMSTFLSWKQLEQSHILKMVSVRCRTRVSKLMTISCKTS